MICINVSVIVPIFNGANTIIGCLDSILSQKNIFYEIICVDDGSTDSTVKCIKQYIKEHEELRIRLLHQNNSGSGSARNRGIDAAQGEYIAFLDSDDCFVDTDALEKMYKLCKEKGVSICGSRGQISNNGTILEADYYKNNILPFNTVVDYCDYQMDYGYYFFIFNREFLINNHIYFPDYIRYQDPIFFVHAMHAAERFVMADTVLYCFYTSDHFAKFNPDKVIDLLNALIDNMKFALEHGYDLLFRRTINRLNFEYSYTIINNFSIENTIQNTEIISLVFKANEIIRKYYSNNSYIMPLIEIIIQRAALGIKLYREELLERLDREECIAIYGAGLYGHGFYDYLVKHNLEEKIKCFLVSSIGLQSNIDNIPVLPICNYENIDCKIFIAVGERYQGEIVEILDQYGVMDYELLDTVFLRDISNTK